ncbi:hypothetical protein VC83_02582 [Pseudogymnoascus destructans]|uniref:Uncharacterized protein n=1 Tax=Pseudogymnoascus destructans TaxID=655981 RepID=A0A177AFV1_9PEZI|nr:uncharacterized protein VC83_02582 [Pseudogymnoascus destructans]OAF60999.1 hypothetical protein VC83_02582 [Pseudogymnoascus destructans]
MIHVHVVIRFVSAYYHRRQHPKIPLNQIPQLAINPTITTTPIPHLPTAIPAATPAPGSPTANPVWLGVVVATPSPFAVPAPAAVHVAAVPGHASLLRDEQIFVALSIPTLTPVPPATVIPPPGPATVTPNPPPPPPSRCVHC